MRAVAFAEILGTEHMDFLLRQSFAIATSVSVELERLSA
jgi:hypothetical protein